uniref:Cationic amino acid transporter C-terminal domain-containing protein n=1 Tax=Ciona intestinalis TaxID=7719 RepID=F6XYD9_CIOIN
FVKKKRCIRRHVANSLLSKMNSRQDVRNDVIPNTDLKRCFNLGDLTFLAISGMIGSGLYVLAGTVTREVAGPSIVVSYVIAAMASILSAFCYAEFSARIPVAGSAYQFTYISVGEFWAFVVGWNVALEHTIYVAAIARTCSGYLDSLFGNKIEMYMRIHAPMAGGFFASYPDFLAVGIILVFGIVLLCGVKLSSKVNIVIAIINILVILFIITTGMYLADIKNWTQVKGGFFPYGWAGTIQGATTLVYSYVGYEVVASATEEAINAARDIPLSLLISVIVVVISYVGGSAALTLMVPWYDVSVTAPFPAAYQNRGWAWAQYIVSIGALAAMLTCLLSIMYVVPRYLLAMSRDGLLFQNLQKISERTKVPYISTLVVIIFSGVVSIVFSLNSLVEFIAVGQLLACTFVAFCVIKLRYSPNQISRKSSQNKSFPGHATINAANECSTSAEDAPIINSSFGTVKKSILHSSFGFLFEWTTAYAPGRIPFYILLSAMACSTTASAVALFVNQQESWWYISIVITLSVIAFLLIATLRCFVQDDTIRTFKVPCVPFVPFCSIVINIILMLKLKSLTWIRMAVWMAIGLIIYAAYGYRNSKAGKRGHEM